MVAMEEQREGQEAEASSNGHRYYGGARPRLCEWQRLLRPVALPTVAMAQDSGTSESALWAASAAGAPAHNLKCNLNCRGIAICLIAIGVRTWAPGYWTWFSSGCWRVPWQEAAQHPLARGQAATSRTRIL